MDLKYYTICQDSKAWIVMQAFIVSIPKRHNSIHTIYICCFFFQFLFASFSYINIPSVNWEAASK